MEVGGPWALFVLVSVAQRKAKKSFQICVWTQFPLRSLSGAIVVCLPGFPFVSVGLPAQIVGLFVCVYVCVWLHLCMSACLSGLFIYPLVCLQGNWGQEEQKEEVQYFFKNGQYWEQMRESRWREKLL